MKKYYNIKIIGNEKFIKQTIKALKLIKEKSYKDFIKINKYLKKIKPSKSSGMDLEKACFNVGKPTAFHSVEWYATCIVHDTHHYYLQHIKKFLWEEKNYKKHEELCTKEQIRFLKKIRAPEYMIKHSQGIIKTKHWLEKKIWW